MHGQGLYFLLSILLIFCSSQFVMNEFNLRDNELSLNLKELDLSFFAYLIWIYYPRRMRSVEIQFVLIVLKSEALWKLALCKFLFFNH